MGEFPSGQRGQTVNLLRFASVVRIHLLPPKNRVRITYSQSVEKPEIQDNWISGFNLHTNKFVKQNNADENLS